MAISGNPLTPNPLSKRVPIQEELKPAVEPSLPTVVQEQPKTNINRPSLKELFQFLEEEGYTAKSKAKYVKHTYDVREDVYNKFMEMCPLVGKRLKEAVTEALEMWCEEYKPESDAVKEAKTLFK